MKECKENVPQVLLNYKGARATIWQYHLRFNRLLIVLQKDELEYSLGIILSGCQEFKGSFKLSGSSFSLKERETEEGVCSTLIDEKSGFTAVFNGGIAIVYLAKEDLEPIILT
jgi:hypothetical protein